MQSQQPPSHSLRSSASTAVAGGEAVVGTGSPPPPLRLGSHLRMTRQRKEVYDVLMGERDHPTASEVFIRAKEHMPHISLATVYNCLETLSDAGVIKQVNLDRGPARYCPNLTEHAHFNCSGCGGIFDIEPTDFNEAARIWNLPEGTKVDKMEVTMQGLCPNCTQ